MPRQEKHRNCESNSRLSCCAADAHISGLFLVRSMITSSSQNGITWIKRANHILVYTPADEPILTNNRCNAAKIFSHPDLQLKFLGSVLSKNTPN
ncbi:hypothetical protein ACET3Z_029183 [Daucus carota]